MKKIILCFFAFLLVTSCSEDQASVVNLEEAQEFLATNATETAVNVIEEGLQYSIIENGTGGVNPSIENTVTAHFHGTLINGDVFWSSVDLNEPLVIKPSQLIKGCQKVIPLMQVGDKWRVFIHPALAYGEEGRPGIPSNSLLIFDIELLDII